MPIPIPPGVNPGNTALGMVQPESFYQGLIQKYAGTAAALKYAALYKQYQAQFPPTPTESTAYQIFNPFFGALLIGEGVAGAATAVADATASVAQTTAQSLPQSPLAGFFQGNIWLRVAEVVLGLVLVAVGLARLTNQIPAATKVAKTVGAVALA